MSISDHDGSDRFKEFARIAVDLFWEIDADFRFTFLSENYEEVTGVPPGQVLGKTRQELLADLLEPEQRRLHFEALESHLPYDDLVYQWRGNDGRQITIKSWAQPFFNGSGVFAGYRGVACDVTAARRAQEELVYFASHDDLTGLYNRREFQRQLDLSCTSAKENQGSHVLCYIDLDQFKLVNDTAGHAAGDSMLKEAAAQICASLDNVGVVGRLSGDEFGLLIRDCPISEGLEIAENLLADTRRAIFKLDDRSFDIRFSIGLVSVDSHSNNVEQLLSQADMACYSAKELGGNRIYLYRTAAGGQDTRHNEIFRASELRDLLSNDRFRLVAQKIAPLQSKCLVAPAPVYEILLRPLDSAGVHIPPDEIVPAAERYGLVRMLDRRVIDKALTELKDALREGAVTININLSGSSLTDRELLADFAARMQQLMVPPPSVCLEITETSLISNLSEVANTIAAMQNDGYRFALDDFGSGFSSFKYMKNLPVNYLKIDGSFVRNMSWDERDKTLVKAINEMSHAMDIETVAESVESAELLTALAELGVDWAQGYAVGTEIPIEEIADQLGREQLPD